MGTLGTTAAATDITFETAAAIAASTLSTPLHPIIGTRSPAWPLEGASRRATAQPNGAMWF